MKILNFWQFQKSFACSLWDMKDYLFPLDTLRNSTTITTIIKVHNPSNVIYVKRVLQSEKNLKNILCQFMKSTINLLNVLCVIKDLKQRAISWSIKILYIKVRMMTVMEIYSDSDQIQWFLTYLKDSFYTEYHSNLCIKWNDWVSK